MKHVKSRKAIKKKKPTIGQHVSLSLSRVGPAYYLTVVSAAILARIIAFLLAGKLCVSVSMPKAFITNKLVSLNCQLFRN